MTRERALELAGNSFWESWNWREGVVGSIADAILTAVAEERESCAKIADSSGSCENACRELIAEEIRERGIPLTEGA